MSEYLQPDNTIDVISPELLPDYELFFGPITPGTKPLVQTFEKTAALLMALNLATSTSWCRKNNWDKEIKSGYQELTFGSKRVKLCILRANETPTL